MGREEKGKNKNPHAVELGRLGAKARVKKLTPEQRREIAQRAIQARWAKVKKEKAKTRKEKND